MFGEEIEVPKEVRQFMMDGAKETLLGHKDGAIRQYRYGHLHIKEYADSYMVHTDMADPRTDPLGHLIHDAPEILAGIGCALTAKLARAPMIIWAAAGIGGYIAAKRMRGHHKP